MSDTGVELCFTELGMPAESGGLYRKTPGGEPAGVYEESLTEADQGKIKAARAKAQGCMDIIKKSGGGG